ncbi:MAG: phosphotransferase, partial [Candidatus Margulisiibacteriota bacterium]
MINNPFQILTHDYVLNTVEQTLGQKLTNLFLPRNSYINRVYELELADSRERIIVKFYRPGRWTRAMIQTEHDFLRTLASEELPVIPPLAYNGQTLHSYDGILLAVFHKKGGRAVDEFDKDLWQQTGRLLARI